LQKQHKQLLMDFTEQQTSLAGEHDHKMQGLARQLDQARTAQMQMQRDHDVLQAKLSELNVALQAA
jgi:hypothetical protein